MRLLLRIATSIALTVVLLVAVGCERAPWKEANEQLAGLAGDIEHGAKAGDVRYFEGLTVGREKIPYLIQHVAQSGIATNYAEHLRVKSDTDATLVYRPRGVATTQTAFTVVLSLQDGKPRVDQFILGDYLGVVEVSPDASSGEPIAGDERSASVDNDNTRSEMATSAQVAVSVEPGRHVVGTEQAALVSYTNTSNKRVWVSRSPSAAILILSSSGELVSEWTSAPTLDAAAQVSLAPFESAYGVVRFTAPAQAAFYWLHGRANGVLSSAVDFKTVQR
jgi:hypothetical protein